MNFFETERNWNIARTGLNEKHESSHHFKTIFKATDQKEQKMTDRQGRFQLERELKNQSATALDQVLTRDDMRLQQTRSKLKKAGLVTETDIGVSSSSPEPTKNMYVEEGCLTEEEVSETDSPDSPISPKVIKGRGSPRKIKSPVVVPRRDIQFHTQTKRISLAALNGQDSQVIGANQLDSQDIL